MVLLYVIVFFSIGNEMMNNQNYFKVTLLFLLFEVILFIWSTIEFFIQLIKKEYKRCIYAFIQSIFSLVLAVSCYLILFYIVGVDGLSGYDN